MKPSDEDLYSRLIQAHIEIDPLIDRIKHDKVTSVSDLADHIFCLRECTKVLEDLRRSLASAQATYEKMLTTVYISMGHAAPEKVVTEYVSIEIVPELGTKVPQPSSPVYSQFLSFLGIPEEVANHEVLKVHFPGWCSYYTVLQSRGKELPEEIQSHLTTYDTTYLKIRKRKAMKGAHNVFEQSSFNESGDESSSLPF